MIELLITQPRIDPFRWNCVCGSLVGRWGRAVIEIHLSWNPRWGRVPKFSIFKSLSSCCWNLVKCERDWNLLAV